MVDIHPISLLLFSATLPLKLAKNGGKFNLKDVTFINTKIWKTKIPKYQNLKNNNNNNNIAYIFNALKPKRLNQLAPCWCHMINKPTEKEKS